MHELTFDEGLNDEAFIEGGGRAAVCLWMDRTEIEGQPFEVTPVSKQDVKGFPKDRSLLCKENGSVVVETNLLGC